MYIPSLYRQSDTEEMIAFMRHNAFATVVSVQDGAPAATHLPLSVSRRGDDILLRGHFAKANPQWRGFEESDTLVIFTGPHAYVSASHYDREESVPTWNYLAVHASGRARLVDAADALTGLHELIDSNDASYRRQWDSLSDRYRDGMLAGIVGFELPVARLEGKKKLSQNKSQAERERIARSFESSTDSTIRATGHEMLRALELDSE